MTSPDETVVSVGDEFEAVSLTMDKRVDLALAVALAALGLAVCYFALHLRTGSFPDPLTPRGLPLIMGGFMAIAGAVTAVRRIVTWSQIPGRYAMAEGSTDEAGHPASAASAFGIIALALLWALLLHALGYLLATPVMLFGALWLMRIRSPATLIAFPILFTLIVWAIFSQLLQVVIPLGPLTALARSFGLTP